MSRHPRANTIKIMEMMDEGLLDPQQIAEMALNWLGDADVAEMAQRNDIMGFIDDDDDDEDYSDH